VQCTGMPGLRKSAIASRIQEVATTSGLTIASAEFCGPHDDLPWVLDISLQALPRRRFCMYFWTISHGGKTRAAEEYRIQTKLKEIVPFHFEMGSTLLMGYYQSSTDRTKSVAEQRTDSQMEVFVAWDATRHLRPGLSSSCQVPYGTMVDAHLAGISQFRRVLADGTTENIIGMRPEYLPRYLMAVSRGHHNLTAEQIQAFDGDWSATRGRA
jgi:hypothetical protein